MIVTLKQKQVIGEGLADALDGDARKVDPSIKKVSEAVTSAAFREHIQKAVDFYNNPKNNL